MRNSVQQLCQSTNPLGKSIDFVTEDIDSMVNEFKHWRSEYNNSKQKLLDMQRQTDDTIKPLQDELALVEEKIREKTSAI
jgi:TRAF3-interacting protein 1